MSASHASSRDDFENSSPALDAMIEAAESAPGFLGGKLSGAGWAGCTVNLVRAALADEFAEAVRVAYSRKTGKLAEIHVCRAADGAFGRAIVPSVGLNGYDQVNRMQNRSISGEGCPCSGRVFWRTSSSFCMRAYVSFVVFGLAAILLGVALHWSWVRNIWFRAIHLILIGIVVGESAIGMPCPLTVWESQLKRAGGETVYTGDFLGYWAHRLIFFRAAPWVIDLVDTLFGLAGPGGVYSGTPALVASAGSSSNGIGEMT